MAYSKQEQAIRAKDSALEKMAKQDFPGAKKLALLARKLDPVLEDIVQIILVCDVHSRSAPKRAPQEGGGGDNERDWYSVLDLDPKAGEDSIRHQCNRMALNLHPEKNKLPGAMEAFRLVCQAKAVLTDDKRRRSYDSKRKSKVLEESRRSDSGFWGFKNDNLGFATFQDSGLAMFRDGPGPVTEDSLNSTKDGGGNAKSQDLGFAKFRNVAGAFDKGSLNSIQHGGGDAKLQNSGFAGFRNGPSSFGQSVLNKDGAGNAGRAKFQESGFAIFQNGSALFDRGGSSNLTDGAGNAKVQDSGVVTSQNGSGPFDHGFLSNFNDGAGNAKLHDSSYAKNIKNGPGPFGNCSRNNLKDGTRNANVKDSGFTKYGNGSGAFDHGSLNILKDGARNAKVQDSGFAKFRECPDMFGHGVLNNIKDSDGNGKLQDPSIAKMQNGSVLFGESVSNDMQNGDGNAKLPDPSIITIQNGPVPSHQEFLNDKKQKADVSKTNQNMKNVVKGQNRKIVIALKANRTNSADGEKSGKCGVKPQIPGSFVAPGPTAARVIPNLKYSDSELSDFEKGREKECFRQGQIWAVYDTLDAMPRFYARINNVISSDNFKVHITWLEPCPDNEMEKKWLYKGLPASCGKFKLGESEEINDRAMFSHLVNSEKDIRSSSNIYRVCPRKGETWAVFKNWKMDWCLEQEMRHMDTGYEFDFVEITSDYCDDVGVSVGFLSKIKGFSTIFSRVNGEEGMKIMAKDKLRFSHRVPSFQMASPNGNSMFFELDPASLPEYLNVFVSSEISTISEIFN